MTPAAPFSIERLAQLGAADLDGLCDVLLDCVAGGASVSFMQSLDRERARAFWRGIGEAMARGACALLVARDAEGVLGTVHLSLDLPENQPHRADLCKLLVHRRGRERGVGSALMQEAEALALHLKRHLLVLDTASAEAARLYRRLGWQEVGTIPGFALLPDGRPCATTYFYRQLHAEAPGATA